MRKPTLAEIEAREAVDREEKRVAHQRNLFTFLPVAQTVEALKEAMLQRAYDLLSDGDATACDAIIEFLPSRDVEKMLDAWLEDQHGAGPKSRWH